MIRYLHVTIIPLRGFMQSTPTLSNSAEIVENESRLALLRYSRMILVGFYTSDPYDDEGVPILGS